VPAGDTLSLIEQRRLEVAGIETFVRIREGEGPPTLFLHGNPEHSGSWLPFLAALRGPAIAIDLPGFGLSERPGGDRFAATMDSYGDFAAAALDQLCPDGYKLVVHDWGVVGLLGAMRRPDRLRRLVVINAVPLLPGYRWHWLARIWRRRGLGEAFNRLTTRAGVGLLLRQARPGLRPMPREFVDGLWEHFDAGTRAAMLQLYRSADPERLAAAGTGLPRLDCPALVVWGRADPYIDVRFGRCYAERLPGAELLELDGAGHWPWIDRPELIGWISDFLA
jgi:pimeloyl-ACP methyl ester carboxylesterase